MACLINITNANSENYVVTDEEWAAAGVLTDYSRSVREYCRRVISFQRGQQIKASQDQKVRTERAAAQGIREDEEAERERKSKDVLRDIVGHLTNGPTGVSKLKKRFGGGKRPLVEDALLIGESEGVIELKEQNGGRIANLTQRG